MTSQELIDKYYLADTHLRDVYMTHCGAVTALAITIASQHRLKLSTDEIYNAAMLHDIGIFLTDAPTIGCNGKEPYIRHGILGAKLLRDNGFDEKYARVAERHTGSGLTAKEIEKQNLPLPHENFFPITQLERLICYADKFFSKSGKGGLKPLHEVREQMARFGEEPLRRFDSLHKEFAVLVTCQ